ncbi:type I-MYXAN CRISPR-associated endonuclease Cas1 [Paenibacillus cisolokensis]|uniref:type I-MYXAN CRISPR-associated endonuclease Cas1 n=1 Tax=Paenibacillus cisolokensis TaxID=1658519 RepID=UPI003D2AB5C9
MHGFEHDEEHEPLIRVMALHALGYCERLFYLEEVEGIRLADSAVFDGRRQHELLPEYSSIERLLLESEKLGLYGRIDCIRTEKGRKIPFEYKRGRSRVMPDGTSEAWPSDTLQAIAYAVLLEEHLGSTVNEARIHYGADRKTVTIKVDTAMRRTLKRALERARELRRSTRRPPIAENERLCARCSLAPVCLPEEERFADQPERPPIRLFPEKHETWDMHVVEAGSTIRRSGDSLVVENQEGNKQSYPIRQIHSVTLHGPVQMSTQTLHLCSEQGISIHWITGGGKYIGSLMRAAGGVQRRMRQYGGLVNEELALLLSARLVAAKIEMQLRYMLRLSRGNERRNAMSSHLQMMRNMLKYVGKSRTRQEMLGLEGNAARAYFACIAICTEHRMSEGLAFTHRSRRPPKDPFNALLSFLYSLLYRDCVQAIVTVGLDPTIGFYHQPRSGAYPLALDLMELFRVPLADMVAVGSVNRMQWSVEKDFEQAGPRFWLNPSGKKKAIKLYESRKQDVWKHPVIGYSLSYARLMELEVRLLEKEWSGKPGLFALNKIR